MFKMNRNNEQLHTKTILPRVSEIEKVVAFSWSFAPGRAGSYVAQI